MKTFDYINKILVLANKQKCEREVYLLNAINAGTVETSKKSKVFWFYFNKTN